MDNKKNPALLNREKWIMVEMLKLPVRIHSIKTDGRSLQWQCFFCQGVNVMNVLFVSKLQNCNHLANCCGIKE